jgi:hypothetical protein
MAIPIIAGLAVLAATGWGYIVGTKDEPQNGTPQQIPAGTAGGLNLTTVAGYVIVAGLVYYFGRKVLK